MGHTLVEWQDHVGELLLNVGADLSPEQITTVGIIPALTRFSLDRPYRDLVEVAGDGSAYLDLPAGWVQGFSSVTEVEYPARQDPRQVLDDQAWSLVRSPADVSVRQILLDRTPTSAQWVRLTFTRPWPIPTTDVDDDMLNDLSYEAVAALAASKCLVSLASQAARSRAGAMPTDFSDGRERARNLGEAADRYLSAYQSFIGIGSKGENPNAPASGSFDLDPQYGSLFHGGRR